MSTMDARGHKRRHDESQLQEQLTGKMMSQAHQMQVMPCRQIAISTRQSLSGVKLWARKVGWSIMPMLNMCIVTVAQLTKQ